MAWETEGYLSIILLAVLVIGFSWGLDRLYGRILPLNVLYYGIRMPGIVLHELAHIAGCLVTGAGIKKVVFFSKEGGSVTYTKPGIPVIGDVIISAAPLLLLPLVLALLTWIFPAFCQCTLAGTLPATVTGDLPFQVTAILAGLFFENLILRFNPWFLLYLYLCVTIVLSLAPSRQDFANAAIGIVIIAGACVLVVLSGIPPALSLLGQALSLLTYPFMLGLIFEIAAGVAAIPFIFSYWLRSG